MTTELPSGRKLPAGRNTDARQATRLLRDILMVSDEFSAHVARELTVNPTDLHAMEHLIANGPMGATELARRLDISTAAVTAVIDRLSALGHASRSPHPHDRRAVIVSPEPASVRKAMSTLAPMISGIDSVIDEFSPDQQAVIDSYLERVLEVYRDQLP